MFNVAAFLRTEPEDFDDKKVLYYDDNYLGPGIMLVNVDKNDDFQFIKLYQVNYDGIPFFSLRAFSTNMLDNPDNQYNTIEFQFGNNSPYHDKENGLNKAFAKFYMESAGAKIKTIDSANQGTNHFKVENKNGIIKLIVNQDVYHGNHPSNYIDILIGDNYSCENYQAIFDLYQSLSDLAEKREKEKEMIKKKTI